MSWRDLFENPKLIFRLADESGSWASRSFSAATPGDLAKGIQRAWDEYITMHAGEEIHPGFALSARLTAIRRWLSERLSRTSFTEEQVKSWKAQAEHWVWQANRELGGVGGKLGLQVRSSVGDYWMTTTPGPVSAKPPRLVNATSTSSWLEWAERWETHDRNLKRIGDVVVEEMEKESRKQRRSKFRVVKNPRRSR